jgi:hypothetical protein
MKSTKSDNQPWREPFLKRDSNDDGSKTSLRRFGLEGEGALSVTPGQQIDLTGVIMTVRDKEVFMVPQRANGKTYTMRNEHWTEVLPQARERAAEKGLTL